MDDRTLRNVYAAYWPCCGLLQPEEIRRIGERYGLLQRALTRLLGWGPVTDTSDLIPYTEPDEVSMPDDLDVTEGE